MEFSQSWTTLHTEAAQFAQFLGKDLELPLSQEVVRAGDNSTDGSTRRNVVQQREGLRHQALLKALKEHGDRQARPVTAFQNFDKLSGAWLLDFLVLEQDSLVQFSQKKLQHISVLSLLL